MGKEEKLIAPKAISKRAMVEPKRGVGGGIGRVLYQGKVRSFAPAMGGSVCLGEKVE